MSTFENEKNVAFQWIIIIIFFLQSKQLIELRHVFHNQRVQ